MNSDANKAVDTLLRRALQNDDNKFHYANETKALAEQIKQSLASQSEIQITLERIADGYGMTYADCVNMARGALIRATPPQKDNTDGQ